MKNVVWRIIPMTAKCHFGHEATIVCRSRLRDKAEGMTGNIAEMAIKGKSGVDLIVSRRNMVISRLYFSVSEFEVYL